VVAFQARGVRLAVAKKIAERYGGGIGVESEEGKGATFYFSIPRTSGTPTNGDRHIPKIADQ